MTPLEKAAHATAVSEEDCRDVVEAFLRAAHEDAEALMRAGIAINGLFPHNVIVEPWQVEKIAVAVVSSLLKAVAGPETLDSIGGEALAGSGFENEVSDSDTPA